ncbi:MAG: hypothetical protein ACRD5H_10855, partial [Nitrososphaerales archaeon]
MTVQVHMLAISYASDLLANAHVTHSVVAKLNKEVYGLNSGDVDDGTLGDYLQCLFITDDGKQCRMNNDGVYSFPLTGKVTETTLADLVYGWCAEHGIDYVSEENVRQLASEAVEGYRHRISLASDPIFIQDSKKEERKSKTTMTLELAMADCVELFVDQHRIPYATFRLSDHNETWSLNGTRVRNWLCSRFYQEEDATLSAEDINSVLNIL